MSDVFKSPAWTLKAEQIVVRYLKNTRKGDLIDDFKAGFRPKLTDDFIYNIGTDGFSFLATDDVEFKVMKLEWKDFSEFLTPLGQRLSRISQK